MDISTKGEKGGRKSVSTVLVEIALNEYTFGVSTLGETFAISKQGPKIVSMLRGSKKSLRALLARTHFNKFRKVAPQQAIADAMMVLDGTGRNFTLESELLILSIRLSLGIRYFG